MSSPLNPSVPAGVDVRPSTAAARAAPAGAVPVNSTYCHAPAMTLVTVSPVWLRNALDASNQLTCTLIGLFAVSGRIHPPTVIGVVPATTAADRMTVVEETIWE